MDLFAMSAPESEPEFTEDKPHLDPVIAMLNELSPDELTPRQALEQLYALKKLLDSGR